MNYMRKVRNAYGMLRTQGMVPVLRRIGGRKVEKRSEPSGPNESRLISECLEAKVNPGIMIDVGAHFGSALKPFADADWRVLAFEPDPQNRRRLEESFSESPNVTIDGRAVSSEPSESVKFYRSGESTGISGLSPFHSSHIESGCVSVTTLEIALQEIEGGANVVDFLKIDTEGFDLFVLKGVPWDQLAPRAILCEFEDSKTSPLGYTFHDLAAYLVERGYQLVVSEWYPIQRYGTNHNWRHFRRYPCELADTRGWGNIIAFRENAAYNRLLEMCGLAA